MVGRWLIWVSSLVVVRMWCYRHPSSGASRHGMCWSWIHVVPCRPCLLNSAPPPPSSRYSFGVHPNSKIKVCVKTSGVVHNSSAGDAQVVVRGFLAAKSHMKVVKSVKRKPPKYWSLRRVELPSCKLSRKPEWHRPQFVRQHAHCSSPCLGLLPMSDGCSRCRE
jgi:hypothetical protein